MKKLLLVSPLGKSGLVGRDITFRLPSLGLLRVAALTPPGWEVAIIDEKIESLASSTLVMGKRVEVRREVG